MDRVQPIAESGDRFVAIDYQNLIPFILNYENLIISKTFMDKMFIRN